MELGEATCRRDGVATRLTCVGCAAPICPSCLVRTPVGLKCPGCTGASAAGRRSPVPVPVVAAVAVVLLPVLAWVVLGRSSGARGGATGDATAVDIANAGGESRIGDEIRSGPFSFKVTQVECVGQEAGTPPSTRVAQGRFCLLYLTMRNVGDRPETYSGSGQLVSDTSAKRYSPGVLDSGPPPPPLVTSAGVREITNIRLNPGTEMQGVLIFDMPVAAKPAEFEFHPALRTIGVKVRLDTLSS